MAFEINRFEFLNRGETNRSENDGCLKRSPLKMILIINDDSASASTESSSSKCELTRCENIKSQARTPLTFEAILLSFQVECAVSYLSPSYLFFLRRRFEKQKLMSAYFRGEVSFQRAIIRSELKYPRFLAIIVYYPHLQNISAENASRFDGKRLK